MINKNLIDSKLPKNPGPKREEDSLSIDNDEYFINLSVESLVSKYGGSKKGFPIEVEPERVDQLRKMQEMFGENFGWNEVICFGFYSIKDKNIGSLKSDLKINKTKCEKLYFKPTRKTLSVIVKVGREYAAEQLIDIGFHFLFRSFCSNA